MEQARLSDGKALYDDSFPVALDENLRKISALDAKKLKRRVPNARFFCPKCYRLDPNNKTEVYPSEHETPRFNRIKGEAHLDSCQYKNAGQYLSTISQKIQVNINGKEIELSLMPYEGRGIYKKPLGPKIKHYCRPDNRKFMELVREILTDYEMEYFHKKYNSYKVHCEGGKAVPFRKLFTSIETAKANTYPYEEKLNIIVGQIESVAWNDHYLLIDMDSSRSPYELRLYLDRYLYDLDTFSQLEGKRIACMGYIRKAKDELYLMEIVSTPHQIAFLDDDLSIANLSPAPSKELSSFLKDLTSEFRNIKPENFYRSYYQHQLEQLEATVNEEINTLQEFIDDVEKEKLAARDKLMRVEKDLTEVKGNLRETREAISTINDTLAETKQKIDTFQSKIDQLEKENNGWWNRLRNFIYGRTPEMIRSEIEENMSKIQKHEKLQQEEQERLKLFSEDCSSLENRLRSLEKDHAALQDNVNTLDHRISQLQSQIMDLKQQVKVAKAKAEKEKEIKEKFEFHGELYELVINADWSILVDIALEHANLSIECTVTSYCVQKKKGFYIPYEYHHHSRTNSSFKRITQSSRYHTIKKMTETIQAKLSEDINQLTNLVNSGHK